VALLHDIGHLPISHSLEPVFLSVFGIDHHHASEDIFFGRVAIGHGVR
jgi:HD superfamily phosphohydrolase